jgi:hypothetical protein
MMTREEIKVENRSFDITKFRNDRSVVNRSGK